METYASESDYLAALAGRAALPTGFRAGRVSTAFSPAELQQQKQFTMNISAVVLDEPTDAFAGVFTRNRFPGVPVIMGRERLASKRIRGILVNNKVANVYAPNGRVDAERVLAQFAALGGYPPDELFPASTGVIGWRLPVKEMIEALPALHESLQPESVAEVARGIMTTDAFPKIRCGEVGGGRIVGIAKGAGMIEPNMATLLVFLFTDVDVPKDQFQVMLDRAISATFNRISVDGDQSTSDMALLISSKAAGTASAELFEEQLTAVCSKLAEDVVRNGEGTAHVIKVTVIGAPDEHTAVGTGKAVVNSPLVKTAVYGGDPNVGRLLMAVGDFLSTCSSEAPGTGIGADDIILSIGGHEVFHRGEFRLDEVKERTIAAYLQEAALSPETRCYPVHDRTVDVEVNLGSGSGSATVLGSDLSYEYVRENADYRT